ncbi:MULTISPECIES: CPXCG motif-containing cysteine-rich protein [Shewanella]|uniref:CPXCG motif-containing cysteine-rich protein n=1 Tax=Shewanella metallivivens TaxID=2872342 RepID=A0ABT5TIQ2_9GAMM|nr:CPXCG motif-containing cysteine-rich protein [Shewanella metallivivens]MDD8058482.1 CPXCG motif-containing cysteine-rich protein [Shewanella metallivivens]
MRLLSRTISCPHCGHNQHVTIDASAGDQEYYDDCRICCNPIHIRMHLDDNRRMIELHVDSDDEQIY